MSENNFNSVDDFFVTSEATDSVEELLNSYSEYEERLQELPSKYIKNDDVAKLNLFKEIHSNRKHHALYRKHDDASETLILYWLSRVKKLASMYASINDVAVFEVISKEELKEVAKFSSDLSKLQELTSYLEARGIILITEPSIPSMKLDGSVFILPSGHAVVALSLRYKRVDYFWFTLMHELSHLCLHGDSLQSAIIEDFDSESSSLIELEADKLALNSFIPRNIWRNCPPKYDPSEDAVISFSHDNGIHPAIVAGRLRKELNRYDILSNLINKTDMREFFDL